MASIVIGGGSFGAGQSFLNERGRQRQFALQAQDQAFRQLMSTRQFALQQQQVNAREAQAERTSRAASFQRAFQFSRAQAGASSQLLKLGESQLNREAAQAEAEAGREAQVERLESQQEFAQAQAERQRTFARTAAERAEGRADIRFGKEFGLRERAQAFKQEQAEAKVLREEEEQRKTRLGKSFEVRVNKIVTNIKARAGEAKQLRSEAEGIRDEVIRTELIQQALDLEDENKQAFDRISVIKDRAADLLAGGPRAPTPAEAAQPEGVERDAVLRTLGREAQEERGEILDEPEDIGGLPLEVQADVPPEVQGGFSERGLSDPDLGRTDLQPSGQLAGQLDFELPPEEAEPSARARAFSQGIGRNLQESDEKAQLDQERVRAGIEESKARVEAIRGAPGRAKTAAEQKANVAERKRLFDLYVDLVDSAHPDAAIAEVNTAVEQGLISPKEGFAIIRGSTPFQGMQNEFRKIRAMPAAQREGAIDDQIEAAEDALGVKRDAKGQPVLDSQGQPVLETDTELLGALRRQYLLASRGVAPEAAIRMFNEEKQRLPQDRNFRTFKRAQEIQAEVDERDRQAELAASAGGIPFGQAAVSSLSALPGTLGALGAGLAGLQALGRR